MEESDSEGLSEEQGVPPCRMDLFVRTHAQKMIVKNVGSSGRAIDPMGTELIQTGTLKAAVVGIA